MSWACTVSFLLPQQTPNHSKLECFLLSFTSYLARKFPNGAVPKSDSYLDRKY
jgi:hypothetical protein